MENGDMKRLTKLGNSYAIPIDKGLLKEANLDEGATFQIQVIPGGGLLIQSMDKPDMDSIKERQDKILAKYLPLFQRLADS